MKVEESLNVTFDESRPPTKLSPMVDDDVVEEEAIRKNTKIVNTNNEEDESIEVDEIINIKESKNHPLDQVRISQKSQENGQARTRELEEFKKRSQRFKAEARTDKPQSNPVKVSKDGQ
ncbi:hypothetical protein Tco_0994172 [Tanacetum coccineum]